MSDNKLKIDVVLADVGESGAVLSDFVTQDLHNTDMAKKADLVNGKVNPTQLPEFSELSGVTDVFSQLEINLRENINTSLTDSKAYADSIVSEVMSKKADLANGRVPKEQATNFKDIPGAKAAIDGLKQSLGQEIIGINDSLENNFAKLTNGKVSQTVLPSDLVYSDRLTREMDDVRSSLQNTITQVGEELTVLETETNNKFISKTEAEYFTKDIELKAAIQNTITQVDEELTALETKTNNKFISKTEAEYFTKDIELKAAIDGLEQKSYTSYASKIVETSKADLKYVDRALGALSTAATKFYPTLALANADIANLQVNQPVQVGESANGGLWYKATAGATTLTKSPYDPVEQAKADATTKANIAEANAKTYTNEKTKNISNIDIGSALFAHVDANDNLVEATGKDGQKYLTGLSGSVQENILINKQEVETVKETLNHINKDEISFAFTDKNDQVVAYLKNDGKLILVDLNKSVQEELNQTKAVLNDLLTTIAKTEVKTVKGLVKSNYTVDASAILSMKVDASNSMPYIKMDSPYRKDDFFVHPCVIELTEPMRGYKYLMCITPYYLRNPMEENPTIYGSNDQVNWEMLTGFDQPLDNPPDLDEPESGEHGYLSDNWLAYDPINKELYCCYRKGYYADYEAGYTNDDRMQLLYRKTTNGLQWTAPKMFTPETLMGVDGQVAPSLVYDQVNKRWALFYLKSSDYRIYVRFNAELKIDGWTEPQEIGYRAFAEANNIRGWHIETKFIGDKLFMLVGDSVNGKYYFAKANDDTFLDWTFSANSVLADTWTYGAYKASFLEVPQQNGNIKLRLYFTDTGAGRLRTSLSPEISIL